MQVPERTLRPLALAASVAAASSGLLLLAVAQGWLGTDVGRGAEFCESARAATVRQPVNALSNLGFILAGLAIAWRVGRPPAPGEVLTRPFGTAYACVVVLLGPASAAMHATQSELGGRLDLLSMYLVASFAASYAAARTVRRGPVFFAQVFLLLVAACQLLATYVGEVPVVLHAGNLAFGSLLLLALVLEARLRRRGLTRADLRPIVAALLVMAVAFVIWTAGQHGWCDPGSWLQAHAIWHLLGAVAAYLLFCFWASERRLPHGDDRPGPATTTYGG